MGFLVMSERNLVHVAYLITLVAVLSTGSAFAQTDFSGEWTVVRSQDNTENPWVGDWFGLPLNKAGLARAESWDASILSLPERSEEHTSELQSLAYLVCRLLLEKKKRGQTRSAEPVSTGGPRESKIRGTSWEGAEKLRRGAGRFRCRGGG